MSDEIGSKVVVFQDYYLVEALNVLSVLMQNDGNALQILKLKGEG